MGCNLNVNFLTILKKFASNITKLYQNILHPVLKFFFTFQTTDKIKPTQLCTTPQSRLTINIGSKF